MGSLLKKGQEAPGGKGLEDAVVAAGPIAKAEAGLVTTERMPRRSREHMQLMNDDDALIKRVRRSK
jgi:hypothetical protein